MGLVLKWALLALSLWAGAAAAEGGVLALGPWVQAAPPNAKVLAAYVLLRNQSDRARSLVAVSSPDFESVEIHQTLLRGEVAQMQSAKTLLLPPGGVIEMKPGGWHLMLIGPKKRWQAGEMIALRLELDDGSSLLLKAPVRAVAGEHAHHVH